MKEEPRCGCCGLFAANRSAGDALDDVGVIDDNAKG